VVNFVLEKAKIKETTVPFDDLMNNSQD